MLDQVRETILGIWRIVLRNLNRDMSLATTKVGSDNFLKFLFQIVMGKSTALLRSEAYCANELILEIFTVRVLNFYLIHRKRLIRSPQYLPNTTLKVVHSVICSTNTIQIAIYSCNTLLLLYIDYHCRLPQLTAKYY